MITTHFFHLPPSSSHVHPLQVENCDSNSRLVMDEDDNDKFKFESVEGGTEYYSLVCLKLPLCLKKAQLCHKHC